MPTSRVLHSSDAFAPVAAKPATLRDQQKADTREKVIEAARELFQEKGYEAATIRDIARRAEVAPGSVFTTFETKSELLQEIVFRRLDELFQAIQEAVAAPGAVEDRFLALAHAAYRHEYKELRLLGDNIGASWTWPEAAEAENRRRIFPLFMAMMGLLKDGVSAGELSQTADLATLTDIIFSCYLRIFRKGLYDGWGPEEMAGLLAKQIQVVLAGSRRGCD